MRINVNVRIGDEAKRLIQRLEPDAIKRFLESQAPALVAQVKRNIKASGTMAAKAWPPLSKEYAKRKRLGKTPGHGANKYAMLRDTGAMFDSIVGIVEPTTRGGLRLGVTATGRVGRRPSNADLLMFHHTGTSRMPARSPVADMTLFVRRFEAALSKFLTPGAPSSAAAQSAG